MMAVRVPDVMSFRLSGLSTGRRHGVPTSMSFRSTVERITRVMPDLRYVVIATRVARHIYVQTQAALDVQYTGALTWPTPNIFYRSVSYTRRLYMYLINECLQHSWLSSIYPGLGDDREHQRALLGVPSVYSQAEEDPASVHHFLR